MQQHPYQRPYDMEYRAGATSVQRSGLLSKVAGLLAFSMAFTVVGGYIGMQVPGLGLPAAIGMLILVFVINFARNVPGLNLALLYLLTTLAGVTLGGIIEAYFAAGAGVIVIQAAATTAAMTLGISIYALTTKRDFSGIGSYLFFGLLAIIAASIVGIFIQSSILQLGIGVAGAVLFSLFLLYDIRQARNVEDTLPNAILVTIGIYLSVLNLFLSLLRIFGFLGSSDE